MSSIILQLSALSVLCGAILTLSPEGGYKHIIRILCSAVLINSILTPVIGFDFESFALESAKLHQVEASFAEDVSESKSRLNRLVIHQQYREYILDKALSLGMNDIEVEVFTQWHDDGLWVPYSLDILGRWDYSQKQQLQTLIRDELGIPEERQHWTHE